MAIQKVLLAGATGGGAAPAVLDALLKAGFDVTALTRAGSKSAAALPSSVKVATVPDEYPVDELVPIVRGQDAVVSTLGAASLSGGAQSHLVDAIVKAGGVQVFVPSEFGSLPAPRWVDMAPGVFGTKDKIRADLDRRGVPWTGVANAAFFEWGLDVGFLHIDAKSRKALVLGDGTRRFSTTRMASIGAAVVGILRHPEPVRNRMALVHSFAASPAEIVAAMEKELGAKFAVEHVDEEAFIAENKKKMDAGDMKGLYDIIYAAVVSEPPWEKLDNGVLEVPEHSLQESVKDYLKSKAT